MKKFNTGVKLLTAAALVTNTAYAMSGKHSGSVETRVDYQYTDGDADKGGSRNTARFQVQAARLNLKGSLPGDIGYRFRWRLHKAATPRVSDNTSSNVDLAYITKSFNKHFSLRAGRDFLSIGGWDFDPALSDNYLESSFVAGVSTYATGISLRGSVANQSINLDIKNSQVDDARQSRLAIGVGWYGNIADMVYPNVSFHTEGISGAKNDARRTIMAVGARVTLMNLVKIEGEYSTYTDESGTTADKDDKTQSIVFKAKLTHDNFRPHIKFFMDEVEVSDEKTKEITGLVIALEYYPDAKSSHRWHLAYTMKDTDNTTGDDPTETSIIIGTKMDIDIM